MIQYHIMKTHLVLLSIVYFSFFISSSQSVPLLPGNILLLRGGGGHDSLGDKPMQLVEIDLNSDVDRERQVFELPLCTVPWPTVPVSVPQPKVTFDEEYVFATASCYASSLNQTVVYRLFQSGALETVMLDGKPLRIPNVALSSGNDLWISGKTPSGPEVAALVYATLDTQGESTLISFGSGTVLHSLQLVNGQLYFGVDNTYRVASALPKTSPFPSSTVILSETLLDFATLNKVAHVVRYSATEYYALGIATFDTGASVLLKAWQDEEGQWWNYTLKLGDDWRNSYFNMDVVDIDSVRTVFLVLNLNVVQVTDTGTQFTNLTPKLPAFSQRYHSGLAYIKPPPSCSDGKKNQNETDLDCGGVCGATCADLKVCAVDGDCLNGYCNGDNNKCVTPTCSDMVKNQNETDVDCGNICGSNCADSKTCLAHTDCASKFCNSSNICATPTCEDGVRNGNETDVDCGGTCPFEQRCADGLSCLVNNDCQYGFCNPNLKRCAAATCVDGMQNQDESDIDCGGFMCNHCANGKKCKDYSDCVSNTCQDNVCVPQVPQASPVAVPANDTPQTTPESEPQAAPSTGPGSNAPRTRVSAAHIVHNISVILLIVASFMLL